MKWLFCGSFMELGISSRRILFIELFFLTVTLISQNFVFLISRQKHFSHFTWLSSLFKLRQLGHVFGLNLRVFFFASQQFLDWELAIVAKMKPLEIQQKQWKWSAMFRKPRIFEYQRQTSQISSNRPRLLM